MPRDDAYRRLDAAAAREGCEPEQIAFSSLSNLDFTTLQQVAGEYDLYPPDNPDRRDLRRALAEAGFFYGDVGDDTLYRRADGETEVILQGP